MCGSGGGATGNQKRAGRAAADVGACHPDYWTLMKEPTLAKGQTSQVAHDVQVDKTSFQRLKCLSASPVKPSAGENKTHTVNTVHLHRRH